MIEDHIYVLCRTSLGNSIGAWKVVFPFLAGASLYRHANGMAVHLHVVEKYIVYASCHTYGCNVRYVLHTTRQWLRLRANARRPRAKAWKLSGATQPTVLPSWVRQDTYIINSSFRIWRSKIKEVRMHALRPSISSRMYTNECYYSIRSISVEWSILSVNCTKSAILFFLRSNQRYLIWIGGSLKTWLLIKLRTWEFRILISTLLVPPEKILMKWLITNEVHYCTGTRTVA
jgi:hypothetical protein